MYRSEGPNNDLKKKYFFKNKKSIKLEDFFSSLFKVKSTTLKYTNIYNSLNIKSIEIFLTIVQMANTHQLNIFLMS